MAKNVMKLKVDVDLGIVKMKIKQFFICIAEAIKCMFTSRAKLEEKLRDARDKAVSAARKPCPIKFVSITCGELKEIKDRD